MGFDDLPAEAQAEIDNDFSDYRESGNGRALLQAVLGCLRHLDAPQEIVSEFASALARFDAGSRAKQHPEAQPARSLGQAFRVPDNDEALLQVALSVAKTMPNEMMEGLLETVRIALSHMADRYPELEDAHTMFMAACDKWIEREVSCLGQAFGIPHRSGRRQNIERGFEERDGVVFHRSQLIWFDCLERLRQGKTRSETFEEVAELHLHVGARRIEQVFDNIRKEHRRILGYDPLTHKPCPGPSA